MLEYYLYNNKPIGKIIFEDSRDKENKESVDISKLKMVENKCEFLTFKEDTANLFMTGYYNNKLYVVRFESFKDFKTLKIHNR